ncbi:MAG: hypothetical protein KGR26_01655 [Cyanobacteria bacterium REEB65]|nr:hypothetical protein [Cyanobacteria bacterium REEB65]
MQLLDAYQLMHDGAVALSVVERNGIRIDVDYCREKMLWLDQKMAQSERRLRGSRLYAAWEKRYGGKLRYSSVPQLRSVLYADLGVKPFKHTEGGEESADEEALRQTGVDGVDHLLRMRKYKKMKDTLAGLVRYQVDGYLYPSFGLHTVQTYRSSSSAPNMQNVPKRDKEAMDVCRRAVVPSPGNVILEIDFSGIEVSIASCYHRDPAMLRYLADPTSDMHTDTAKDLLFLRGVNTDIKRLPGFGTLRQSAKNGFVFPQFYGDYYEPCAYNIAVNWLKLPQNRDWRDDDGVEFNGVPIGRHLIGHGIEMMSDYIAHVERVEKNFWGKRFPVYRKWREDWYAGYQRAGYFDLKTGFRCSGVYGRNQATNYPVQGAAFHCLLWTLIQLVRRMRSDPARWRSRVVGEVHDSVLFDARPEEVHSLVALTKQIAEHDLAEHWNWIIVPMRVEASVSEVDGSWADMREVG